MQLEMYVRKISFNDFWLKRDGESSSQQKHLYLQVYWKLHNIDTVSQG
jgi:hypothetical protein